MALFEKGYVRAIREGRIGACALYTLTDRAEQDDHCAHIYNKSLLYLVSNASETRARIPIFRPEGEPILGMAKFIDKSPVLRRLISKNLLSWVQAPNDCPPGDLRASTARAHGGFDDDRATVTSTLGRILGSAKVAARAKRDLSFRSGLGRMRNMRSDLNRVR